MTTPARDQQPVPTGAEADVVEQRQWPVEPPVEPDEGVPQGTPLEADPLDVADQHRDVPLDEEDYR